MAYVSTFKKESNISFAYGATTQTEIYVSIEEKEWRGVSKRFSKLHVLPSRVGIPDQFINYPIYLRLGYNFEGYVRRVRGETRSEKPSCETHPSSNDLLYSTGKAYRKAPPCAVIAFLCNGSSNHQTKEFNNFAV